MLRIGVELSFILLFTLKQSGAEQIFVLHAGRVWPLVILSIVAFSVTAGFLTEFTASLSSLAWAWAMYSGLRAGVEWYSVPIRAALYVILFAALATTGPGRFSLDSYCSGDGEDVSGESKKQLFG